MGAGAANPESLSLAEARAQAIVRMSAATAERVARGDAPKGDVLGTARIAGIQAAKRTAELIPLAHPLAIEAVDLAFTPDDTTQSVAIEARVRNRGRTGCEMEALTAVTVAALTIYDMLKAVDRGMVMGEFALWEKHGGRRGSWRRGR